MSTIDHFLEFASLWTPFIAATFGVIASLRLLDWWLLRRHSKLEGVGVSLRHQAPAFIKLSALPRHCRKPARRRN